jgi:hypothetical protein
MNITFESLQKSHGKDAAEVFNTISDLGGFGVRATGFHSQEGGLAVNEQTPNYDKIKTLLKIDDKKDGKSQ